LRATLPVTIFISPNVPLDEAGNLLDQTPNHMHTLDIDAHAPPVYGEHILDQLYADIDNTGHMTPSASSGMNTPFYTHSRSSSVDNLASLNGIASTAVRPDALSSRLQNLTRAQRGQSTYVGRRGNTSGGNTPRIPTSADALGHHSNSSISMPSSLPHQSGGYFDHVPHPAAPPSNPLSRHPSNEDLPNGIISGMTSGHQTPEHIDFSDLSLNKVPSYTTAVRAPLRNMSYNDLEALPNYNMAVSAPPSPTRRSTSLATPGGHPSRKLNSSEPATLALDASRQNTTVSNLRH
jgi:hypothetical protein